MLKLYFSPGACSFSPHIILREAGIDHELVRVDLRAKKTAAGDDFHAVNPKGSVPALQLPEGEVLTEGPAIVQYLADLRPEANLAPPAGTLARYRLQEWLNFITSELHKGFSPLFNPRTPAEYRAIATENLGKRFDYVNEQLAGKDYLTGAQFTIADAYLFTVLGWCGYVNLDLARWPALAAFVERVAARPAVQAARAAEKA